MSSLVTYSTEKVVRILEVLSHVPGELGGGSPVSECKIDTELDLSLVLIGYLPNTIRKAEASLLATLKSLEGLEIAVVKLLDPFPRDPGLGKQIIDKLVVFEV